MQPSVKLRLNRRHDMISRCMVMNTMFLLIASQAYSAEPNIITWAFLLDRTPKTERSILVLKGGRPMDKDDIVASFLEEKKPIPTGKDLKTNLRRAFCMEQYFPTRSCLAFSIRERRHFANLAQQAPDIGFLPFFASNPVRILSSGIVREDDPTIKFWPRWRNARCFRIDPRLFALITADCFLYLIKPPPQNIELRHTLRGMLVPMRVGMNPLLAIDGERGLQCACQQGFIVAFSTTDGWLACYDASRNEWKKPVRPFENEEVRALAWDEKGLYAFVQRPQGKTHILTANPDDLATWKFARNGPDIADADPVLYVGKDVCVTSSRADKPRIMLHQWQNDSWKTTPMAFEAAPNEMIVDCCYDTKEEKVLLIVAKKMEAPEGISDIRLISAD